VDNAELTKEDIEFFKEYALEKTAGKTPEQVKKERAAELELLDKFKKNPSKETFTPLYQSFKPLIYQATRGNMIGSPIPQSAHMALAAQSFLDSIRTHNPKLAPFHIHAFSTINNKGKRLNYKYQNIGYIPEARATKYQTFTNASNWLRDQLGREPSSHELADELGWSPKLVETFTKEIRKDLLLEEGRSEQLSVIKSDKAQQALRDISYNLIPEHQLVLDRIQGWSTGTPLVKKNGGADIQAVSKSTGLSVPKIRSALKTITRKYKQYHGLMKSTPTEEESDGDSQ
jgi:DNA-directed RNA polymerase specialized sigma subunit